MFPTFATSRLQEILAAKGETTWARNGRWILPENARLPHNIQGSFTCRKCTAWDRRLYFPSEGRRAEDFSPWKIRRLRPGLNPRTWVPKASTLPLDHRSRLIGSLCNTYISVGLRRVTNEFWCTKIGLRFNVTYRTHTEHSLTQTLIRVKDTTLVPLMSWRY